MESVDVCSYVCQVGHCPCWMELVVVNRQIFGSKLTLKFRRAAAPPLPPSIPPRFTGACIVWTISDTLDTNKHMI
jgi:hypothetical protein